MSLLILGLIFINVNLNIDISLVASNYHYVNLFPTFVGCILILFGCNSLAKESVWFKSLKTKIVNIVCLVLSIADNLIMLFNGDGSDWLQLFYILCSAAYYYQMYIISRGIIDIDEEYGLNVNGRFLIVLLIIMISFEVISYGIVYLLPGVAVIASFFTVAILFVIFLFIGKIYLINKEYNKYLEE